MKPCPSLPHALALLAGLGLAGCTMVPAGYVMTPVSPFSMTMVGFLPATPGVATSTHDSATPKAAATAMAGATPVMVVMPAHGTAFSAWGSGFVYYVPTLGYQMVYYAF